MPTTRDELPADLAELKQTCDELADLERRATELRKIREVQFRAVLERGVYTQAAIIKAMDVSRSRFTQLMRAWKSEKE